MSSFANYKLYSDPYLEEFVIVPNKKLKYKRWMKDTCYPKRIRKKWHKRFGTKTERQYIISGLNVFAHPDNIQLLKELN